VSALAGLGAASVSFGTPAAAAAPQLIDFAMRQIPAQHIRAAGYSGVVNFVSLSRPGSSFGSKPITRPYAESLTAAGLVIVNYSIRQGLGGTAPSDFTARVRWRRRRRSHRLAAARRRRGAIVHRSSSPSTRTSTARPGDLHRDSQGAGCMTTVNSVLGAQRTGVYGGIDVCQWAAADGVIGNSSTPGRRWAWQTRAWSGNQIHPAAVLYQRVVSTASNPGPLVGGLEVDVNDVLAPDCGQWNLHP
jgi:hypothetical protein